MIGAFWICLFMIVVGIILYIGELRWRKKRNVDSGEELSDNGAPRDRTPVGESMNTGVEGSNHGNADIDDESGECCGLHLVCEKDSLSPMTDEILYYDDEELDRFIGRDPNSYTSEETEEFRDVLMTLRPEDVAGWARSVTQRRLELPPDVRDELLMLVNEQRRR